MRIAVINTDAERFLARHYARHPELAAATYAEQMQARYDSLWGVADFYSRNFRAHGHDAIEIFPNNVILQAAWAREHGMAAADLLPDQITVADGAMLNALKRQLRPYKELLRPLAQSLGLMRKIGQPQQDILLAQIEDFAPDLILVQDIIGVGAPVMRKAKRKDRILMAQHGVDLPENFDAGIYDVAVSMLQWVVERFRAAGVPAEQVHLAFEPSVLGLLGPAPEPDIAVSFVGSLGADHGRRLRLLEAVAERFPFDLWSPTDKEIPAGSPLKACFRGEASGKAMLEILRRSKITLNSHIDVARGMAANMRLFEATGVGTYLLTDAQKNLSTLFEPDIHVGAYGSVEDCLAKIRSILDDEAQRRRVAQSGQAHTLAVHTYRQRTAQLLEIAGRCAKFA